MSFVLNQYFQIKQVYELVSNIMGNIKFMATAKRDFKREGDHSKFSFPQTNKKQERESI